MGLQMEAGAFGWVKAAAASVQKEGPEGSRLSGLPG